jgi:hypothetical protein
MSEPALETEAILPPMFSALDRCDRCGAQAKARVMFSGGTLLFCGHHIKAYGPEAERHGGIIEGEQC